MKKTILLTLSLLCTAIAFGQTFKEHITASHLEKEDSNNEYRSADLTNLDFAQALAALGVRVFKYNIGDCDSTYKFILTVEEFVNGNIVKADTIMRTENTYIYFARGEKEYHQDYIDQIKIIAHQDDDRIKLHVRTYGMSTSAAYPYEIKEKGQFYTWRCYPSTKWKLNKKVPLLVFASSWLDKEYNFQRFCGVVNLKEDDPQTNELLTHSPRYYVVSYKIF